MLSHATVPTDPTGSEVNMISQRSDPETAEIASLVENKKDEELVMITDQAADVHPPTRISFYG